MRSPLFRSIPYRGFLALAAAFLVRCTPEVAQCIALPGSSIYVTPSMAAPPQNGAVHATLSVALQGRAALDRVLEAVRRLVVCALR